MNTKLLPVVIAAVIGSLVLAGGVYSLSTKQKPTAGGPIKNWVSPSANKNRKKAELSPAERMGPKRLAQLNQTLDGLLTKGDNKKLGEMVAQVARVAEVDPKKYLAAAQYTADRVRTEAPGSPAAELAQRFLILDTYKREGLTPTVYDDLAQFVSAFPASKAPVQLYEKLAKRMAYDDDLSQVVALVDHGVEQTKGGVNAPKLTALREKTVKRVAWTEKIRKSIKPSRTSTASDHARLIGRPFPLQGKTLSGQTIPADGFFGKWVYVQYWANWCPPCHPKMVALSKKKAAYKALGVWMVGVNLDPDASVARKFVQQNKLSWPHISAARDMQLTLSASVDGQIVIPLNILIAPDGRVVEAGIQSIDKEIAYHLK